MGTMREDLHVAVTGLNATDNPGPGVSVMRALRHARDFNGELVGLAYDTLDPGLYCADLDLMAAFLLPYPDQGADALLARLSYIHERTRIDVLIPTLDSELPALISLEDDLQRLGIRTFLPTRAQLDLRAKTQLMGLGESAEINVPRGETVNDAATLFEIHQRVSYPLVIKGIFYGATICHTADEAVAAFHRTAAIWGLPVIAQQYYEGEEYDVVAVGDGRGGLVGAVPMRKTTFTDKGKGWAGVAVKDPMLLELTRRFMAATSWRGPCEVEILKTPKGRYLLLEINPRFPAWTYLSVGAGQNLPWAVARLAMGERVEPFSGFKAGAMFVRIALDQLASIEDFEALATSGEKVR